MADKPAGLRITDNSTGITYDWAIYTDPKTGARDVEWDIHSHQVGSDIRLQPNRTYSFRLPIFPLTGGLNVDRLATNPDTYAKADGDGRYPHIFAPPPLVTTVTLTNGSSPFQIIEFNSLLFFIGGRYVYYIDPTTHTATQDKDLGVGKSAAYMAVLNQELVVFMGEAEKVWTRNTAGTWTQAADAVYGIVCGIVDNKLWRVASSYLASNCLSNPRTLTSWAPSSGNEYQVGDPTYPATSINDYQGGVWIGKYDGMYAADPNGVFHNQTPQLRAWPHANNCKGSFVAKGSLWCPSAAGLLQIKVGSSRDKGPEVTARPNYRWWVRGGVEFGGTIWLLCTDESSASAENTCIVAMLPDPKSPSNFIYHEICRLGSSTKGYAITATTKSTVPELYATYGNNAVYVPLALGGGRDIDDALHSYKTTSYLETGRMAPSAGEGSLDFDDLGLVAVAQGVEFVAHLRTGDSYTLQGKVDAGSWQDLKDTQEPAGTAAISGPTTGYSTYIRYFPPASASGHFFEVNWTGALASGAGTDRSDIVAAYLFGYLRPIHADMLIATIVMDGGTWSNDNMSGGVGLMDTHTLFTKWLISSTPLTVQLQDYQENYTTRFLVTYFKAQEIDTDMGPGTHRLETTWKLQVYMVRIPFDPNYGVL